MNKAIFIDKDGTLINDVPYNVKPELVSYSSFAMDALKILQEEGYLLIIVSNQSGVAKGYFTELDLAILINKIRTDMVEQAVDITAFYYCPHFPDTIMADYSKECGCRKPAAGMILQAADEYNIDLAKSWLIGDILDDMEAGKRAGCKTILLDVGNETEWQMNDYRFPNFTATNLKAAAEIILNDSNKVYK